MQGRMTFARLGALIGCALIAAIAACGESRATDDAGVDVPTGRPCGGLAGQKCAASEYCDYPDNNCGVADAQGTCQPRGEVCPAILAPVCACDGKVYSNECAASAAGVDVAAAGGCPVAEGGFACGYRQCDLDTEYCRTFTGTHDQLEFACEALPEACKSQVSCACLDGLPCSGSDRCTGDAATGLTLSCPRR